MRKAERGKRREGRGTDEDEKRGGPLFQVAQSLKCRASAGRKRRPALFGPGTAYKPAQGIGSGNGEGGSNQSQEGSGTHHSPPPPQPTVLTIARLYKLRGHTRVRKAEGGKGEGGQRTRKEEADIFHRH